jgi:hypothetical protein
MIPPNYDITEDPAFKKWRERLAPIDPRDLRRIKLWVEHTGKTLTELVELRKQHRDHNSPSYNPDWEDSKLTELNDKIVGDNEKTGTRKIVRSFYKHHGMRLTQRRAASMMRA